eukprot:4750338-Alexandrium_andersonii.AAC.1
MGAGPSSPRLTPLALHWDALPLLKKARPQARRGDGRSAGARRRRSRGRGTVLRCTLASPGG